ncbi:hypothetical protein PENSUB_13303 [Penicillium subrubescens]|uniref:hAT-like transposase RNase-H fold domain-containing protein n=1 Tax=Penicillium subrubescens TaxID=1316194 RepID=A0A1Q5SRN1_9EURO|nr:hypothetical protein PENSUB_13303 [Penicillium subrubescens]
MLQALQLAQKKLSKYYSATDNSPYGTTYALATILCPSKKLRYFDNEDWRGGDIDFMKQYQEAFRTEFATYQKQAQKEAQQPDVLETINDAEDEELASFAIRNKPNSLLLRSIANKMKLHDISQRG